MCILIFCTTFVWNIPHSKTKWTRYFHKCTQAVMWSAPLLLPDFNETWIFSTSVRKMLKYQISSNPSSVGRYFFLFGETDTSKLTFTFRNFANARPLKTTRSSGYSNEENISIQNFTTNNSLIYSKVSSERKEKYPNSTHWVTIMIYP